MSREPEPKKSFALRVEFCLLLTAWILSLVWMIANVVHWLN
ncbi:hypothetical protein [uncultured Croceicoccus sp.]|nr:hypothetical protein [uncultured Croceicoccus sp.]